MYYGAIEELAEQESWADTDRIMLQRISCERLSKILRGCTKLACGSDTTPVCGNAWVDRCGWAFRIRAQERIEEIRDRLRAVRVRRT